MSTGEFVIVIELALLVGGMFGGLLRGPQGPQGPQGFTGEKGEPGWS
ncbi:hypothetical protein 40AC_65 [Mycobacterium phage 40AC]|uniref:Minor tail protein n=1 Tax=Mycobacterium phage 40AC TaxID=1458717 RepID=W8EAM0_9CAUD|nr:hypothetical protein ST40AC_65 [Mycobacterium phage 40AC]AHJ86428.1 hypothetical protein 40AC_65 [Mycobacterium phage 40AC]